MAKYLYRLCPKCGDYLGVVVPELSEPVEKIPIDATCLKCGYNLSFRVGMVAHRLAEDLRFCRRAFGS